MRERTIERHIKSGDLNYMSTEEMSPVKVGLIGLGTVGSGVVDILIHNANEISRRVSDTNSGIYRR